MKLPRSPQSRQRLSRLVRLTADLLVVFVTYALAFALRLLMVVWTREYPPDQVRGLLEEYVFTFLTTVGPLEVVVVVTFAAFGLHSAALSWGVRRRLVVLTQAVGIAYLVFGFGFFYFGPFSLFPRAVLIMSWLFALIALGSLRVGARLWRDVSRFERQQGKLEDDSRVRAVLVIGGAGYIGPLLCERLLADGCRVVVLDSLLYGGDPIRHLMGHPQFELQRADFRNVESVVRAMEDVDAVVHLGGLVGDPACALDERLTFEINVAATRMIAEAARGLGIRRFVFASSCSVYGASDEVLTEESALNPVSLYAQTKIESEKGLLAMNGARFSPIILRFATIYGMAPRPRFDLVVNLFSAKAVIDQEILVFGGDQWRPFVHVADIAAAIRLSLRQPLRKVAGQVINIGSEAQNLTIREVAELVGTLVPGAQVVIKGQDIDRRNYRVSFERARRLLGFEPTRSLEDGIMEVAAALRSGRIRDFRDPRYSNYLSMQEPTLMSAARSVRISPLYEVTAPSRAGA